MSPPRCRERKRNRARGFDYATPGSILLPPAPTRSLLPPLDPIDFPPSNDPVFRHGLPESIRAFKSYSARRINGLRGQLGVPVWQRSYWDRIIRDQGELDQIRDHIRANPGRWAADSLYPAIQIRDQFLVDIRCVLG